VTTDHPTPEALARLAAALDDAGTRAAAAHLLGCCELCQRVVRGALDRTRGRSGTAGTGAAGIEAGAEAAGARAPDADAPGSDAPGSEGAAGGAYDAAMLLTLERGAVRLAVLHADQLRAVSLWAVLMDTPRARRLALVRADPRFHNWALAARLLEWAGEFQWRDTGRAPEACRLALAIAERLPAARYPAGLPADLRAQALGRLADALRLDGRLSEAEETLDEAWEALEDGTSDPLARAALLRLAANLELAVGANREAAAMLRNAASIYRLHGNGHEQGRTLQQLAVAVGHQNPVEGIAIAERALALVEPGREPRLELGARHLLIWFLNDCGLSWQALDLLERSRPLYRDCGESEPLLLLPWLEARICRRLGELGAAERGLAEAWHLFRAAGWEQEVALVSLDLAEVLMAREKRRQALRLLASCAARLRRRGMHAEGLAAWEALVAAAAGGDGGSVAGLLREAALYFRRAWRRATPRRGTARGAEGWPER
jgi:tetratricopeptide (TPR) repeat protein